MKLEYLNLYLQLKVIILPSACGKMNYDCTNMNTNVFSCVLQKISQFSQFWNRKPFYLGFLKPKGPSISLIDNLLVCGNAYFKGPKEKGQLNIVAKKRIAYAPSTVLRMKT